MQDLEPCERPRERIFGSGRREDEIAVVGADNADRQPMSIVNERAPSSSRRIRVVNDLIEYVEDDHATFHEQRVRDVTFVRDDPPRSAMGSRAI